jgi:type VI secretion system VasD/TssJ family lipoprotein
MRTLCVLAVLLAGCSARTAQIRGIAPLNQNDAGESTPVDVRFYSLRGDQQFQRAAFESLWVDASKVLGSDLVGQPVVTTVFPGAAGDAARSIDLGPDSAHASHIGVMALFRQGDGSKRTLVVPADRVGSVVIECVGRGVRLAGELPPASGANASGTPSVPSTPSTPSVPSTPSTPSVPSTPSMPNVP